MFSQVFHRLKFFTKRLFSTIPTPGDGMDYLKYALHKDNIKLTTLIAGGLIVGGGLVVENSFVLYKVLENTKDMKALEAKIETNAKENAKDMKALEAKIETNAKESAKDIKALERVIVSQYSNFQTAMISVLASSSNQRPVKIVKSLGSKKSPDLTSMSNGDQN